jgi:hypothetical protein
LLESEKFKLLKKKFQFFWVEINHKVAWGERGGTNKKIELHYLTHGKAY